MTNQINFVSFFENVYTRTSSYINLITFLEDIRYQKHKSQIQRIRNVQDKRTRTELKKQLPAVTVSGTFCPQRILSDFMCHSGYIQVDFDKVVNPQNLKNKLKEDKFTFSTFTSPSGNGVKAIVKIYPSEKLHCSQFLALEKYYQRKFNITIDPSCKDITRLMFVSSDSEIYVNADSLVFPEIFREKQEVKNYPIPNTVDNNLKILIERIVEQGIDITPSYYDWIKIGFALANQYGESGRPLFIELSKFYPGFSYIETNKQYNKCLKAECGRTRINSIFRIAYDYGVTIKD